MTLNPWRAVREMPHVTVTFLNLPDGLLGFCDHESSTIYLTNGMPQRQRRSVLHHEMQHLERGPVADCDHLSAREERAVEMVSAKTLIPMDALVDALLWSQDEHELSEQLNVDVATVRDRLAYLTDAERAYINAEMDRREAQIP